MAHLMSHRVLGIVHTESYAIGYAGPTTTGKARHTKRASSGEVRPDHSVVIALLTANRHKEVKVHVKAMYLPDYLAPEGFCLTGVGFSVEWRQQIITILQVSISILIPHHPNSHLVPTQPHDGILGRGDLSEQSDIASQLARIGAEPVSVAVHHVAHRDRFEHQSVDALLSRANPSTVPEASFSVTVAL